MRKKLAPILLFLLTVVFFWENIFKGEVFYFGDNFNFFVPNKVFLVENIKKGIFPLWNPLIFSGVPYIADLGIFPFYPGNIFFFLFPPLKAISYLAIFEIFLAGFFMYLYLVKLGFGKFLGFLGAVLFMLSGSVVTHIGNISILNVIIWLPLILYFIEKGFSKGEFRDLFFGGILLTISFLGGHLQLFYYNVIFIAVYIVFKIKAGFKTKVCKGGIVFLIFVFLSMFQILPFLQFANLSTRPRFDYSYSSEGSINPVILPRLILAQFYGRIKDGFSWGPGASIERGFGDVTGYIGILPLIFCFLAVFFKLRETRFWIFWGVTFLVLSFGKYTPVFFLFYKLVPFFERFRNPAQFLFLYSFSMIVLSIYGLEVVLRKRRKLKKSRLINFSLVILIILISYLVVNKKILWEGANLVVDKVGQRVVLPSYYSKDKLEIIIFLILENMGVGSLIIFSFFYFSGLFWEKKISAQVFKLIIFFLIFSDLLLFSKNSLFWGKLNLADFKNGSVEFLKENLGNERYLSTAEIIPYTGLLNYWNQTMVREPFAESRVNKKELEDFSVFKAEAASLPFNLGMNWNLGTINGYGSMVLRDYADFFDSEGKEKDINKVKISDFESEKIDFLGVKYLVIDKSLEKEQKKIEKINKYKLVFSGDFVKIYENKRLLPRIFFTDNKGQAEIKSYQPNKIVIEAEREKKGTLVLTDSYYPGWEVFVDGERRNVKRVKKVKGVEVEEEEREVVFVFKPKMFYLGVIISGVSFFLCSVLLYVPKMKRK